VAEELISPDHAVEVSEYKLQLEDAVAALPERRQTVAKRYLAGEGIPAIAASLGWRENQVRHLLYRGLADLRKRLTVAGRRRPGNRPISIPATGSKGDFMSRSPFQNCPESEDLVRAFLEATDGGIRHELLEHARRCPGCRPRCRSWRRSRPRSRPGRLVSRRRGSAVRKRGRSGSLRSSS